MRVINAILLLLICIARVALHTMLCIPYIGRKMWGGGGRGAEVAQAPTLKEGGAEPLIFQMCVLFCMPYKIQKSLKTTVRRPQKHSLRVENSILSLGEHAPRPP